MSMFSLARVFVAAAVTLTASPVVRDAVVVAPVPVVAPAATQAIGRRADSTPTLSPFESIAADDEVQARVEIGPAVLRIYDANGKVIAVE